VTAAKRHHPPEEGNRPLRDEHGVAHVNHGRASLGIKSCSQLRKPFTTPNLRW